MTVVTVDNPAQIAVSGSLSANGTTFNYNGGSANLNFTSTGLISGANNIFNLPVIVPYTDVPSLAGNTSFDQVGSAPPRFPPEPSSLNLLGTNTTNFSYQFPNGFTVASGATLAVGPNVPGLTLGQTLSDAGALTFSSGDVVTVDNPGRDCRQRQPHRQRHDFQLQRRRRNLKFTSTAILSGGNNTFNLPSSFPIPRPVPRRQYQLRSGRISAATFPPDPVAQPPRHQHHQLQLSIPQWLHRRLRWNYRRRAQRAGLTLGQTLSDAGA